MTFSPYLVGEKLGDYGHPGYGHRLGDIVTFCLRSP